MTHIEIWLIRSYNKKSCLLISTSFTFSSFSIEAKLADVLLLFYLRFLLLAFRYYADLEQVFVEVNSYQEFFFRNF
jgi:hypothetical protein